jgi:hypothetical protein
MFTTLDIAIWRVYMYLDIVVCSAYKIITQLIYFSTLISILLIVYVPQNVTKTRIVSKLYLG